VAFGQVVVGYSSCPHAAAWAAACHPGPPLSWWHQRRSVDRCPPAGALGRRTRSRWR
jgi:hypothetical protein